MTTSPKIHFLQHKDGRFLNVRENQLYDSFINASYEKNFSTINAVCKTEKYQDYEVYTITEDDFMREMAQLTTDTVIAGEYFFSLLNKFGIKLPTISQINKDMYKRVKQLIEVLKPISKMHSEFLDQEEETTDDVSGHYAGFITEVAKVDIYNCSEATAILHAWQLDKNSMIGIAKKILKKNGIEVTTEN